MNVHIYRKHGGAKTSKLSVEKEEISTEGEKSDDREIDEVRSDNKTKQKEPWYLCEICEYGNSRKIMVKYHMKSKHLGVKYRCGQCGKIANSKGSLNAHKYHKHGGAKTSNIIHSDEEIITEVEKPDDGRMDVEFKDKIREVRKDDQTWYICQVCQFESKSSDIQHIRNHIEGQHLGVRYPCNMCDKISTSFSGLKDHKRNHHSQKPILIKHCEYCDYSTRYSGAFRIHVNSVHLNIKPVQCEVCDKKLRSNIQLKLHIRSVHQKKTEQCDICFKFVRNIRIHKQGQHKKANCKYCDKQFDKYNTMVYHIQQEHKDREVFKCPSCEYKTKNKNNLKKHDLNKHNINYKFCDQCEYKTKLKSHLQQHQKLKHDCNFEKFNCKYCDYQADRKVNVEQHQRSQHENVRYPCDQCDYQATRRQYLYKHIETLHKDQSA